MSHVAAIGIDAGSTTCKLVAVDGEGRLLASVLEPASPLVQAQAAALLERLGADVGATGDEPVAATGYGRKLVAGATTVVTKITCHARGVFADLGAGGTLVDIGGQDSKVIRIGPDGRAVDFAMNDKCAAGTGRFLEHTASRLGVPMDELGPRALQAGHEERISSTCTVFAESEIISLIAAGAKLDAILRGLHRSLVGRIAALARPVGVVAPLLLSGGVALNPAIPVLLGEELGQPVTLPSQPQLMGALGAALVALAAPATSNTTR